MKLTFAADVDGQPKPVLMRFGNERDLAGTPPLALPGAASRQPARSRRA